MGGLSLTGLWLFLAAVLSTSVYLAVAGVWVANKTAYRSDAAQPTGSAQSTTTIHHPAIRA